MPLGIVPVCRTGELRVPTAAQRADDCFVSFGTHAELRVPKAAHRADDSLGRVRERLNRHDWKSCRVARSSRVQIPPLPPLQKPPTGVERLNGSGSLGLSLSRLNASVPIRDVVPLRHPTPEPGEFPPSAARSAEVEEVHSIGLFPSITRVESPSRPLVRPLHGVHRPLKPAWPRQCGHVRPRLRRRA